MQVPNRHNDVARGRRVPKRVDGLETRQRLREAALGFFSERGFSSVSVSQITKSAQLSVGAFYQYYTNKDELFREIVERFLQELEQTLDLTDLRQTMLSYLRVCKVNAKYVKLIHLNEYTFEWIRNEYESILKRVSRRFGLSPIGHFYCWSPLKFVVAFADLLGVEIDEELVVDLVLHGPVRSCAGEIPTEALDFEPVKHVIDADERREQILASAESLFATYGYEKTQVYDIARSCGIGVGTVYLYFQNKLQILRELVRWINRGLRYNVRLAIERCGSCPRLAQELVGLLAFIRFFRMHFNMYRIVRQSQSIDKEIAREYYVSIYEPYKRALSEAVRDGRLLLNERFKDSPTVDYLAIMLMSYGHYAGEKFLLSGEVNGEFDAEVKKWLTELFEYVCRGLQQFSNGEGERA